MIEQRILDFPDDGGVSLEALVAALPEEHGLASVGWPSGFFRLSGLAAKDQVYLLMAVARLCTPANEPLLNEDELLVPIEERANVEQALISCGGHRAVWTELLGVSGEAGAVAAFEALWAARVYPLL